MSVRHIPYIHSCPGEFGPADAFNVLLAAIRHDRVMARAVVNYQPCGLEPLLAHMTAFARRFIAGSAGTEPAIRVLREEVISDMYGTAGEPEVKHMPQAEFDRLAATGTPI